VDVGSSFLPSDILAAYLFAQMENWADIQEKRRLIWNFYFERLQEWAGSEGVGLPVVPEECEHPAHLFYLLLPFLEHRNALIGHLESRGVHSTFHYVPLHLSEMGRRFGGEKCHCPVTESTSDRLLRIPLYYSLNEADLSRIIAAVKEFRC
jgi:dTDP-4-amino-4,6-dideoxygalactose transaminase